MTKKAKMKINLFKKVIDLTRCIADFPVILKIFCKQIFRL